MLIENFSKQDKGSTKNPCNPQCLFITRDEFIYILKLLVRLNYLAPFKFKELMMNRMDRKIYELGSVTDDDDINSYSIIFMKNEDNSDSLSCFRLIKNNFEKYIQHIVDKKITLADLGGCEVNG